MQQVLEVLVGGAVGEVGRVHLHDVCGKQAVVPGERDYSSLLQYSKHTLLTQNILEYARVDKRLQKYTRVCKGEHILEYVRIDKGLRKKITRVCKDGQGITDLFGLRSGR